MLRKCDGGKYVPERRTEDRGRRTEGRGQRAEDGGQRVESGGEGDPN
jgi:hypothetical protein